MMLNNASSESFTTALCPTFLSHLAPIRVFHNRFFFTSSLPTDTTINAPKPTIPLPYTTLSSPTPPPTQPRFHRIHNAVLNSTTINTTTAPLTTHHCPRPHQQHHHLCPHQLRNTVLTNITANTTTITKLYQHFQPHKQSMPW
jgi:hypothetical protein